MTQITLEEAIRLAKQLPKRDFIQKIKSQGDASSEESLSKFHDIQNSGITSGSGVGGSDNTSGPKNVFASLLDLTRKFLSTQEAGVEVPYASEELIKVDDLFSKIIDSQGNLNKLSDIGSKLMESVFGSLENYYKTQTGLLHQINKEAGLTGQLSKDFRETITDASPGLARLGIQFKELADAATKLVTNSGRFNLISTEAFVKSGAVASAYVGTLTQMIDLFKDFEQIGLGATDTIDAIDKAGKESLNLGLRSKTITDGIKTNISKINEYGFQKGVEGLAQMVRKSTEFRMGMESVFQVADKVFSAEGALELSANLQVLGGAIGDFNDPLKLMYMATNNVEGLQDALIGAAGSLATYNSEQGRFEITGVNLRRAKEMASQLGVSYQELAKGAIAASERSAAASSLMSKGLSLDDKQKEFLTNIAQMKGGKMQIEIQSEKLKEELRGKGILKDEQTAVAIEDLNQDVANVLLRYQEDFKQKTTEDIVRDQATDVENIMRDVNYIAAVMKIQAGRGLTDLLDTALNAMGTSSENISKSIRDMTTKGGTFDIRKVTEQKIQEIKDDKAKKDKGKTGAKASTGASTGGGKKQPETTEIKVNQYSAVPSKISEKSSTSESKTSNVTANNNTSSTSQTNNTALTKIVEKKDGTYTFVANNQQVPIKTVTPSAVTPESQSTDNVDLKSLMTQEDTDSPLLTSVQSIEKFLLSKNFTTPVSTAGVVSVSTPTEIKKEPEKKSVAVVTPEKTVKGAEETAKLAKSKENIVYEELPEVIVTAKRKTPKNEISPDVASAPTTPVIPPTSTVVETKENFIKKLESDKKLFKEYYSTIIGEDNNNSLFSSTLKEQTNQLSLLNKEYNTDATKIFTFNNEKYKEYNTTLLGGKDTESKISNTFEKNKELLSSNEKSIIEKLAYKPIGLQSNIIDGSKTLSTGYNNFVSSLNSTTNKEGDVTTINQPKLGDVNSIVGGDNTKTSTEINQNITPSLQTGLTAKGPITTSELLANYKSPNIAPALLNPTSDEKIKDYSKIEITDKVSKFLTEKSVEKSEPLAQERTFKYKLELGASGALYDAMTRQALKDTETWEKISMNLQDKSSYLTV